LSKINNEAKVRRSTRSVVLGKAKVISYKNFKEARAKRAAKKKATAGKKNRGRKRKNSAPEAEIEASLLKIEAGSSVPKDKMARISGIPGPAPWRAPVARMY
jgi:predicted flap endonuclease-1-like 5' DNA nuclease